MTFPPTLPKASFKVVDKLLVRQWLWDDVGVGDTGVTVVGDLVVLSKGLLERRRSMAAGFLSLRDAVLLPEWCVMARLTSPLMVQVVSRHLGTYVEVEACGWKGVAWLSHLERVHVRNFFDKHVRLNHDSVVVPDPEDLYRVFLDFPKLKRP